MVAGHDHAVELLLTADVERWQGGGQSLADRLVPDQFPVTGRHAVHLRELLADH